MRKIRAIVRRVAPTDLSVLIMGESGTGKEVIARDIHAESARCGERFVKINSAALPNNLVESELFGYETGAFTGATPQRVGRIEWADQGTLFFDEVAELTPDAQSKLLQIMQEKEFTPLGSNLPVHVDVRIIAATCRNLAEEVERGHFRDDLYHRLNVVQIALPSLRDRDEDILPLLHYFWKQYTDQFDRQRPLQLRERDCDVLRNYHWPGNIRELENLVKKLILLGDFHGEIQRLRAKLRSVPQNQTARPSLLEAARAAQEKAERSVILRALERNGWNRKKTAQMLHISYRSLLSKIKKLEIG